MSRPRTVWGNVWGNTPSASGFGAAVSARESSTPIELGRNPDRGFSPMSSAATWGTLAGYRKEEKLLPSSRQGAEMRMGGFLIAAIAAAVLATTAGAVRGEAVAENVSAMSYAPKPFYDDLSRMRIRFTTTGRAKPGHYYAVILSISGPDAGPGAGCTNLGYSEDSGTTVHARRILGGRGQTQTVWFKAGSFGRYFCHGRATVTVDVGPKNVSLRREIRTLNFRILRAP